VLRFAPLSKYNGAPATRREMISARSRAVLIALAVDLAALATWL
jgi:hypothetical protein